jgi:hypothetical protein
MSSKGRTWFLVVFGSTVVLLAGGALVYKMTEFAMTIIKDDISGFGIVALAVYFTGMSPLLFLTLWGMCAGHFRDIERPKYRMLELDELINRNSAPVRAARSDGLGTAGPAVGTSDAAPVRAARSDGLGTAGQAVGTSG